MIKSSVPISQLQCKSKLASQSLQIRTTQIKSATCREVSANISDGLCVHCRTASQNGAELSTLQMQHEHFYKFPTHSLCQSLYLPALPLCNFCLPARCLQRLTFLVLLKVLGTLPYPLLNWRLENLELDSHQNSYTHVPKLH